MTTKTEEPTALEMLAVILCELIEDIAVLNGRQRTRKERAAEHAELLKVIEGAIDEGVERAMRKRGV
jgi:hypothetical protein